MSGVTKHIFDSEIRNILSMWNEQLKTIQPLLSKQYTHEEIVCLLEKFYPYEWQFVCDRYKYYSIKDNHLKRRNKKIRYKMQRPEVLLKKTPKYKSIFSKKALDLHYEKYSEDIREIEKKKLFRKREPKIKRIREKVEKALLRTQLVTPIFIDKMIGLYERKGTSQKDRAYILLELKKYYNNKVMNFFSKLNDVEINMQLRHEAFEHLQSFGYRPRLRRQKYMQVHTKNKKRKKMLKQVYARERFDIPKNPDELEYRIHNSKEQQIKEYDYFISHSSKDSRYVQELIYNQNKNGKNIFCDWINDVDYLKRHLLCEATLEVLKLRMKQSNAMIFVESDNSLQSPWCKYELNYFKDLMKPIFYINIKNIQKDNCMIEKMNDNWYVDKDYEKLVLIEKKDNSGAKIDE